MEKPIREPGRHIFRRFNEQTKRWSLEGVDEELDTKVRIETLRDLKNLIELVRTMNERPTPPERPTP